MLREEQLRWVVGSNSRAHEARPMPMALSSPTCAWRRAATTALDEAGIPWRQLLGSANLAALAPVVQAGLAVTVLPASAMRAGLRVLDEKEEGLPPLPTDRIGMLEASRNRSPEAKALAEEIRATLSEAPRAAFDRAGFEFVGPDRPCSSLPRPARCGLIVPQPSSHK